VSDVIRPPHAYVPGATPRHPEGWFDPLKAGITGDMTEAEMEASLAWQAGMTYRAEGFYWECHEVLEALWLVTDDGPLRSYVQAVIQMANAQLKEKMGRPKASARLCDIVVGHLDDCAGRDVILGQAIGVLRAEAVNAATRLKNMH
jgi:hypothetical protein